MIHPAGVTAVRDVIIINTQQYLSNFYTCYFQSPNILYRCSNHQLNMLFLIVKLTAILQ